MAAKTKTKHQNQRKWTSVTIFSVSVASLVVLYLWHKISYLLNKVDNDNEKSWWFLSFFTTQDLTAKGLSVTDAGFYTQLLDCVKEDIEWISALLISVCSSYFNFTYYLNENTLIYLYIIIAVVSFSVAAIFCYFAKHVRSKNKKVKNNKKAKETKNKYDGKEKNKLAVKDEHVEVTGCYGGFHLGCYGSKKYLFGWLTGLMMVAFLLSIPWEFVRLYQSMVAEKVTHISTGVPVECVPTQMSMLETIRSWCRWQFSWTADPCLQYHKALLIDPLWQVPPLMVLSSAFSHCIMYPVEILFGGLGRAFRAFFTEIPSPWQPVMLVIIVIFLLLMLVMLFGYRIHLPMLLKIEPKTPVYLRVKERVKPHEVEKEKQKLNMSIEASQDSEVCSSQETQYTQDKQYTQESH